MHFFHLCIHTPVLTNDTVSLIEPAGVVKATVGMEMCKACQPQSSVCVCEGEGDAVWAGLWDRKPPFGIRVHWVWCLRGAVHPGGHQGVLVVVSSDLFRNRKQVFSDIIFISVCVCVCTWLPLCPFNPSAHGKEETHTVLEKVQERWSERANPTINIFIVETEHNYPPWLKERGCMERRERETGCLCSVRIRDYDISKANAAAEAELAFFGGYFED